jgi:hypothetical protein
MRATSWKIAGTSLLALGLTAGALAYQEEKAHRNRKSAPQEAILEGEIGALKKELTSVTARLRELEQSTARRPSPNAAAADGGVPWWGKLPSDAASQALLQKLEVPISMSFANETPLEDVLKYIKSATQGPNDTGIPIYVDPVGLNEAEKTMTSPVSLDLEGVPLRITLRLLLKQIGLTYDVKNGLLTITAETSEDRPVPILEYVRRARQGELSLAEIRELTEVIRALEELNKASRALFGREDPAQ